MAKLEKYPVKFELSIDRELEAKIAEWRRKQPDLPNRNEAIRRLIDCGLEQGERKK